MGVESTAERGSTWSCKRISPKVSVEILRRKNTSKLLEANPLTALGKTGNGKVDKKSSLCSWKICQKLYTGRDFGTRLQGTEMWLTCILQEKEVEGERDSVLKSVGRTQPPIAEATGNGGGNGVTGNKSVMSGLAEETVLKVKPKRVTGHVENEELWKLRRCLVGVMDVICSASSIYNRLVNWGLGDINVQRLGAKMFLLTIEDEELYLMLEDVNWSYLKEIFREVLPWSEKINNSERATWIEIRGLPLHCWNSVTLKKIAALWGSFEALGRNDKHSLDCEKATILISTTQASRIEEIIDVEVGDRVFPVIVREIGFNDGTSCPLCNNGNKDLGASESTEESVSNSKFDTGRSDEKTTEVDRNRSSTEEEAFQAMWVERDCIDGGTREHESLRGQIKLSELMGEEPKVTTAIAAKETGVGKTREVEELRENKGGSVVSHAGMSQGQDAGKDCGLENYPLRNVVSQSGLEPIRVDWGVEADVVEHRGGGFNGQLPEIKNLWAKAEFGNN
ncbi:hypothetical protein V6N13_051535 [Hibiscus sabdariffa]